MLENGTYATIAEIAKTEKISEPYVRRVLRLTLLRIGKGLAELNYGHDLSRDPAPSLRRHARTGCFRSYRIRSLGSA